MIQHHGLLAALRRDLEAPLAARRFGSGWFAGFFALLLAIACCLMVVALRWPGWFSMPQLATIHAWPGFRAVVHVTLLASYALALTSLLLRPRKALGFAALGIGIAAALLGGAGVQPAETKSWGVYFGVDFFVVNLLTTGFMFAPLERLWPRRADQRLFRVEWREDLFYYLVSSMLVQVITFLTMAPSRTILAHAGACGRVRRGAPCHGHAAVAAPARRDHAADRPRAILVPPRLPSCAVPVGFHAVHHSAKSMDWLAGSRMHFFEIVALRGLTSLPLLTFGFAPSAMQAYVGIVYVYSSLIHANLGGELPRLGKWLVTPRFHHWHHGLEEEAIDVNFAIHFPWLDRLFGTHHLPEGRWPEGYGVPEAVPQGYARQFLYPFRRRRMMAEASAPEPG